MSEDEIKKVYLKRDNAYGWIYICPHCLKRIVISHKMKSCSYCNGRIDVNKCTMYKGKVKN